MMTRFTILFFALFLCASTSVLAAGPGTAKAAMQSAPQASGPAAEPGPKDRVKESIQQEFDFEGDVIETEYLRPNSAMVETVKKRSSLSLVRIKTSFLEKILSTVDEL